MRIKGKTYLLIFENTPLSLMLIRWLNQQGAQVVAVGEDTRTLTKLMYAKQLHDFIYCDINNQTSLLNMFHYLKQMHSVNSLCLVAETEHRIALVARQAEICGKILPEHFIASAIEPGQVTPICLTQLSSVALPAKQNSAEQHKCSGHQQQY